jgi:hypothetical protein
MDQPQTLPKGILTLKPRDATRRVSRERNGIEVHELQLGSIHAQLLYRLRCDCGRAWFDVQLPKFVKCPSCGKLGMVNL